MLTYIGCSPGQSSDESNSSTQQTWEEVVPDLTNRTEDVLPDVAAKVVELEKQGKGRKIIAFSLFGSTPKYIQVGWMAGRICHSSHGFAAADRGAGGACWHCCCRYTNRDVP